MSNYAMFYNSENGDRVYDADSFSDWLKKFFTTGVFEGDCQVTALGDMVVNLAPGYANIMGKVKELENQTFTLEPADGSYPRIDTIVIERNDTDRDITAKVVTGQLSGNTPAPTPRVWENGVYQLVVAEVYVAAGATEVTQADITDKRSDPDVCGIVAGTVTEMDFSQFTAQFESYFEQFKASNLEEFDEWFEMIKGQLSEDAAGHLQNEINDINAKIPSGASSSNKLATESEITEINDNLNGFKFYPIGTDLVALVADDSFYKDANGKYVLADSAIGQSMIDNVTYKALASTEETHGEVGADSATPFKGASKAELLWTNPNLTSSFIGDVSLDLSEYQFIVIQTVYFPGQYDEIGGTIIPNIVDTSKYYTLSNTIRNEYFDVPVRYVKITSSGLYFTQAAKNSGLQANTMIVPKYILGIKEINDLIDYF